MAKTKGIMITAKQSPVMLERIYEGLLLRHKSRPWPIATLSLSVQYTSVQDHQERWSPNMPNIEKSEDEERVDNEEPGVIAIKAACSLGSCAFTILFLRYVRHRRLSATFSVSKP